MVVNALQVGMLVQDPGLFSITHPLHIVLHKVLHLLIGHPVILPGIDGCMERHILAAQAAPLIDTERVHRPGRVIHTRGEEHRGMSLGDLPLVVLDSRTTARSRCINLYNHREW